METKKIKAISLIFDWNLWPRQSFKRLDSANLARMKESLRNGFTLPPIIVNKKDLRIIDGFHRTTAYLKVFGDDAEIEAIMRGYKNDSEMFLEAGRLNAYQGLTLNSKDRAHFIIRCFEMKIPPSKIAEALGMNPQSVENFVKERSAKTKSGEIIPLSAGAKRLHGKVLTKEEEHLARTIDANVPERHLTILINSFKADMFEPSESLIMKMKELRNFLNDFIEKWEEGLSNENRRN